MTAGLKKHAVRIEKITVNNYPCQFLYHFSEPHFNVLQKIIKKSQYFC